MGKKRKFLAAAAFSVAIAAGIHVANQVIFFNSTRKGRLGGSTDSFYEWRFGRIYYTKQGNGRPLLLVHRIHYGACEAEWNELKEELSKHHTVYTLDLLGCGRSEKPKITYTNYLYVQLLNEFIRDVIKGKTDIMTSQNAASIATMACLVEPSLFNRMIFIQPEKISATAKTPKANHKALKYLMETPLIGTCLYNMISSQSSFRGLCREYYFHDSNKVPAQMAEIMNEAAHLGGPSARYLYASVRSHFTDIYIGNAIRKLDHSIYVIGSDDEESREATEEYTDFNPAIETASIPKAGMLMQIERPAEVLELCRLFLEY